VVNNIDVLETVIPQTLKNAVCQLVVDLQTNDPTPIGEGREVISETVDVISTTYAPTGSGTLTPVLTKVENFLKPLYGNAPKFLRV
jgi:hypothetical protein